MISVVITASDDAASLAVSLAALVPAAAEGLVRDVAVLGAVGTAAEVADDAGAVVYAAGGFASAIAAARGPWLAGLPTGARLAADWMEIIGAHAAGGPVPARLVGPWGLGFAPRPDGWLVPKAVAPSAGAVEQDLQRLARRSGRRLRIFDRS